MILGRMNFHSSFAVSGRPKCVPHERGGPNRYKVLKCDGGVLLLDARNYLGTSNAIPFFYEIWPEMALSMVNLSVQWSRQMVMSAISSYSQPCQGTGHPSLRTPRAHEYPPPFGTIYPDPGSRGALSPWIRDDNVLFFLYFWLIWYVHSISLMNHL